MDTYDKGPDARRDQPGGADAPVSRLPGDATAGTPENPPPPETQGPEEPAETTESAVTTESAELAVTTEPTETTESAQTPESSEPAESRGPAEVTEAQEPAVPTESLVTTEPTESMVGPPELRLPPEPPLLAEAEQPREAGEDAPEGVGAHAPPPPPPAAFTDGYDTEPAAPRTGVAALSLRYQIVAALALAVVAVAACVHLGMVFLHVAPANTVTKKHGAAINNWIYPEFEQNWKLFAPNPLQQNIDVQARAEVRTDDGGERTTGWYDLSALDGAAIDGNPLPSHTQQNELRRAWDFYTASHDGENHSVGLRGALSEDYLRRVVALRLGREHAAGRGESVERVQVRSRTSNVPSPKWSDEKVPTTPLYHQLPWWLLVDGEATGVSA